MMTSRSPRIPSVVLAKFYLAFFVLTSSALAQMADLPPSRYRDGLGMKGAFRPVVADAAKSTVRVRCGGKDVEMGTIVGADGWILTKLSELRSPVTCRLRDGRELPAKLVGAHPATDLAMLKIEADKLTPVEWNKNSDPAVGQLITTAGLGEDPLAVGVVSVPRRKIAGVFGVLGIRMDESDKGPKIAQVFSGSGAEKAGLKSGDIVQRVFDQIVRDRNNLSDMIRRHKPGDTVRLFILRGETEMEFSATLTQPTAAFLGMDPKRQTSMEGPISNRSTDFPIVIQHDTALRPIDCGGPIVDLSGKVVGVNIARAGRTECYAIPADQILPLLNPLETGKMPPKESLPSADNRPVIKSSKPDESKGKDAPLGDAKAKPPAKP